MKIKLFAVGLFLLAAALFGCVQPAGPSSVVSSPTLTPSFTPTPTVSPSYPPLSEFSARGLAAKGIGWVDARNQSWRFEN